MTTRKKEKAGSCTRRPSTAWTRGVCSRSVRLREWVLETCQGESEEKAKIPSRQLTRNNRGRARLENYLARRPESRLARAVAGNTAAGKTAAGETSRGTGAAAGQSSGGTGRWPALWAPDTMASSRAEPVRPQDPATLFRGECCGLLAAATVVDRGKSTLAASDEPLNRGAPSRSTLANSACVVGYGHSRSTA